MLLPSSYQQHWIVKWLEKNNTKKTTKGKKVHCFCLSLLLMTYVQTEDLERLWRETRGKEGGEIHMQGNGLDKVNQVEIR